MDLQHHQQQQQQQHHHHHHHHQSSGTNDGVISTPSTSSTHTGNNNNNSNTNADENVCQNMVSNLPLLFAGGYPTSLEKITENQLEKFIPFMVQCSLGYIQIHNVEYNEPEWWPEDVPFSIPLVKQKEYRHTTWHAKLKEIVIICYQFHKGVFLLRFCNELASYQPECLRFINNYNSTTSLFDRVSNKLLVTFRNENMLYDQLPVNSKKTLLPRVPSSHQLTTSDCNTENMVEQALFDIYLCDNCEAELYSLDAYTEHEKTCLMDDDVIFCGTADYDGDESGGGSGNGGGHESDDPIDERLQQQSAFLHNFNLSNNGSTNSLIPNHFHNHHHLTQQSITTKSPTKKSTKNRQLQKHQTSTAPPPPLQHSSPNRHTSPVAEKIRRIPTRSRNVMVLSKCPTIPITSPAGLQLVKSAKTQINLDYLSERLDRTERFCPAPLLYNSRFSMFGSAGSSVHNRPKFMDKRFNYAHISCTYKRPPAAAQVSIANSGGGGGGGGIGGTSGGNAGSIGNIGGSNSNIGGSGVSSCNFGAGGYALQTNHQSSTISTVTNSKSSNVNKISIQQYRDFKWPRRQFSQINRERAFLWLNANILKTCVPLEIRLKKITQADIDDYLYQSKCQRLLKEQEHQLRKQQQQLNRKAIWMSKKSVLLASTSKESNISPTKRTKVVDIIDLCSSDDDEDDDDDIENVEINKIKHKDSRKKCKYETINVTTTVSATTSTIKTISSTPTIETNFGFDAKSGIVIHKINSIDPLKYSHHQTIETDIEMNSTQLLSTPVRSSSSSSSSPPPPPPQHQQSIAPIKLRKIQQTFTSQTTTTNAAAAAATTTPIITDDGGLSSQQAISPTVSTVITPLNISQSRNIYHSTSFPSHGLLIFKKSPLVPHHSGSGAPQDSITGAIDISSSTNSNCDLQISPTPAASPSSAMVASNLQQQQPPSVFLFSKLQSSPISLTNHRKSMTATTTTESSQLSSFTSYQNQENNFSFLNGGTVVITPQSPQPVQSSRTSISTCADDNIKFNNLPTSSINNNKNNNRCSSNSNTTTNTSSSSSSSSNSNNKKIVSMIGPDVIIERIEPSSTTVRSSRMKNDQKDQTIRSPHSQKKSPPSTLPPPQISIDLT